MASNVGTKLHLGLEVLGSEHHTIPEIFALGCQREEDMVSDPRSATLR